MDTTQALDELFRMDESALPESLRNELEAWRIEYQEFYNVDSPRGGAVVPPGARAAS
jgi:hypothetical protein